MRQHTGNPVPLPAKDRTQKPASADVLQFKRADIVQRLGRAAVGRGVCAVTLDVRSCEALRRHCMVWGTSASPRTALQLHVSL